MLHSNHLKNRETEKKNFFLESLAKNGSWFDDEQIITNDIFKNPFTRTEFTSMPRRRREFVKELLEVDPKKRLTAEKALQHNFFENNAFCVEECTVQ